MRVPSPLGYSSAQWLFTPSAKFRARYAKRANLRFALIIPDESILQPRIRADLKAHRCRHVVTASRRCVGFAIGAIRVEPRGAVWYLLAMQSDLAFAKSARVRDYVRGWRTKLFSHILDFACSSGAVALAIPPADEVARAATWWIGGARDKAPNSWTPIYDGTADQFGLKLASITEPLNLQIAPRGPASPCVRFYIRSLNHEGH